MGNSNKTRIAVLDSNKVLSKDYQIFDKYKEFEMQRYKDFTDFISKQNPQSIKNIIVRYDIQNSTKKMKQQSYFNNICLFLDTGQATMKDQLVTYVKKYNLHTNIYLFTGKKTQVKIQHHQKPFIKLVSNNLDYILSCTSQPVQNFQASKKMDNLFDGFYRKVMVKILGKSYAKIRQQKFKQQQKNKNSQPQNKSNEIKKLTNYQMKLKKQQKNILKQTQIQSQLLQQHQIVPLYYQTIEDLQKSFISTACQYVICSPQHSFQVQDCKKKCDQDFNIIVKGQCDQSFVWSAHQDLSVIIKKMKNFTQISQQQSPTYAHNIIIIDNKNKRFEQYIDWKQLQYQIYHKLQNLQKQQQKAKQILNALFFGFQQNKKHLNIQQQNNINISYTNLSQPQQILKQLKKSIYSFIVVLSQDESLQQTKKLLRKNNFHNRVQLTSIKQTKQQKDIKKIWQYKLKQINKITYQLKYQIGPISTIHLYKSQKSRQSYFNQKLGLKATVINNIKQFQKYVENKIQKIIDSSRLLCTYDDYLQDIKPFVQKHKNHQTVKRLNIIIFDQKNQDRLRKQINKSIKTIQKSLQKIQEYQQFEKQKQKEKQKQARIKIQKSKQLQKISAEKQKYNHIELIQFDRTRLQNHLKNCKVTKITIPFYKAGILKNFQNQCNILAQFQSSYQIHMKSSVYRSNQTMKKILQKKQKQLATQFNLNFLVFKTNHLQSIQQIIEFQQKYIPSYVQLWQQYYQVINPKQNKLLIPLDFIKEQICFLFYRCKAYDLLKVRQQDFQEFYIEKIKSCRGLLDLQLACIYVLTLPHGFNQVISELFMKRKKTKLAIKIFVTYMFVLMSNFYNFKANTQNQIKLVVFLQKDSKDKLLQNLQNKIHIEDIFYTTDFVFCVDRRQQAKQQSQFHTVVFSFNNHQVLQKTLLQNYLQVQRCAFYKELIQYIIPPFVKFKITQIKKKNGLYEICLQNIQQKQCIFADLLFKQNNVTQQMLYDVLSKQLKIDQKKQSKKQQNTKNYTSLYKKTQKLNMKKVKQQVKQQFKNGQHYNNFFVSKNHKKYLTAMMYLNKTQQRQKKVFDTTNDTPKDQKKQNQKIKLNQFQVQKSYLQYQMNQYQLALQSIEKLIQVYQKNKPIQKQVDQSKTWKQLAAQKIKQSILFTKQSRKHVVLNKQKKKLWKLSLKPKGNQADFKLQALIDRCDVNFDSGTQIFYLDYANHSHTKSYQQNIMFKRALKYKQITTQIAPDLFGQKIPGEISKRLYISLDQCKKKLTNGNQTQILQPIMQQHHLVLKQNMTPFDALYGQQKQGKQWSVFYLKNQVQVAFKNQHYHKKLPTLTEKKTYKKLQEDNMRTPVTPTKKQKLKQIQKQQNKIQDQFSISNQKFSYHISNQKSKLSNADNADKFSISNKKQK